MKRILTIVALLVLATTAFGQDGLASVFAKRGIVFGFSSVLTPTGFTDAFQAGVGVKGWLDGQNALRGVVRLAFAPDQGAGSTTDIGLGAAWERHFGAGPVTPYMGAFAGTTVMIQGGSDVDLYFGGVFGGEMPVMDNLHIFGEYDLRFLVDDIGFWIDNVANFGFILYFD